MRNRIQHFFIAITSRLTSHHTWPRRKQPVMRWVLTVCCAWQIVLRRIEWSVRHCCGLLLVLLVLLFYFFLQHMAHEPHTDRGNTQTRILPQTQKQEKRERSLGVFLNQEICDSRLATPTPLAQRTHSRSQALGLWIDPTPPRPGITTKNETNLSPGMNTRRVVPLHQTWVQTCRVKSRRLWMSSGVSWPIVRWDMSIFSITRPQRSLV